MFIEALFTIAKIWEQSRGLLVRHLALDFISGHDLMVHGIKPHAGLCISSTEPAWDSPSPSLSAPPLLMLPPSLSKINILTNLNVKKRGGNSLVESFSMHDKNENDKELPI